MSESTHIAKAYLLLGCPFSLKFLLFMTEAGLLDQIEVVSFDMKSSDYEERKAKLDELAKASTSFPTVEIEPGVYVSDSDGLIDHFKNKNGIDNSAFPILDFYKQGVFEGMLRLFRENRELKSKLES